MTKVNIKLLMKEAIEKAGGVRALARKWDLSPAYISDVKTGRRDGGPEVLKRLGLTKEIKRVVIYKEVEK